MWPFFLLSCITARYVDPGEQEEDCVAEEWYRENPEHAPLGFRADIERVVPEK